MMLRVGASFRSLKQSRSWPEDSASDMLMSALLIVSYFMSSSFLPDMWYFAAETAVRLGKYHFPMSHHLLYGRQGRGYVPDNHQSELNCLKTIKRQLLGCDCVAFWPRSLC